MKNTIRLLAVLLALCLLLAGCVGSEPAVTTQPQSSAPSSAPSSTTLPEPTQSEPVPETTQPTVTTQPPETTQPVTVAPSRPTEPQNTTIKAPLSQEECMGQAYRTVVRAFLDAGFSGVHAEQRTPDRHDIPGGTVYGITINGMPFAAGDEFQPDAEVVLQYAYYPEPEEQPDDSSFRIDFIDVGQADAALIRCDGESMLIDGGNVGDSNVIYTYLQKQGVTHLDYIVCTHAHEDHVGGLSGALNYATVTTAFSPVTSYSSKAFSNFKNNLGKQNVDITIPKPGTEFDLGSADCQVIGPIYESDDPNNTSIVIRIEYGQTSFLFTGDAETAEENDILDAGYDIGCTVLKVGHHGSDTSTSYRWLRQASPEYAVISVGTGNSYGHPTETVLSRLRDADVKVYRTDLQGDIICTSDGKTVTFTTNRNQNADTLEGAGAGGNHGSSEAHDYVLNTKTMKFHDTTCSYGQKISDQNRKEVTCTRDELIDEGYSPCGVCKP